MATRRKKDPDAEEWSALRSFVGGLYEELDKLCKKAPSAALTDLALSRVNRAIRDAKELDGGHDKYMADLVEFVPAGSNPEVRDAVLVLREITRGLTRLNERFGLLSQL